MVEASRNAGGSQDRARAARILAGIIADGRTTDQMFGTEEELSPLVRELVYGTLRRYFSLDAEVHQSLDRGLKGKDHDLRCLLLVGAYQLRYTRIPNYAAISETVNACRALKKPWARGLVNGVLRNLSRAAKDTLDPVPNDRSYELPDWIVKKFDTSLGGRASEVMLACLERAPMSLRVNVCRTTPGDYLTELEASGHNAKQGWLPESLVLDSPTPARQLPGYREGRVSIQDSGAMFAAKVLVDGLPQKAPDSIRVLDACAAPGGKLFHLAERLTQPPFAAQHLALTGLEISEDRLAHLQAEAGRLGHPEVELIQGDATSTDWHDGRPYDAILVDAPCSGSGTLRRHPDIKILRKAQDLLHYQRLQSALITNLYPMLNAGGVLVYCTCSLFEEENDQVIGAFLDREPTATLEKFELPTGIPTRLGWQLLPLPAGDHLPNRTVDGFYFSRIRAPDLARNPTKRGKMPAP